LKNKIILSGLFLTTAISCSAYRPIVLNAFLDPSSTTEVDYDDINWSYALFNQYASGLSYDFSLSYSTRYDFAINNAIVYNDNATYFSFNEWDTIGSNQAIAINVSGVWRSRINQVFFDRSFNRTTKKANINRAFELIKFPNFDTLNWVITIRSNISYSVNIGSVFMSFESGVSGTGSQIEQYNKFITFYNKNNQVLQAVRLDTDVSRTFRNYQYNLSTIITGVNRFDLDFQWIDIPPFSSETGYIYLYEFNIFTQNQEVSIPDEAGGNRFGFEFVAVEWWNILGHLQNFIWWILNQSPIAPVFEWIDTYVITWVSGLITFITGVFRL
jgi:hypothetical protein